MAVSYVYRSVYRLGRSGGDGTLRQLFETLLVCHCGIGATHIRWRKKPHFIMHSHFSSWLVTTTTTFGISKYPEKRSSTLIDHNSHITRVPGVHTRCCWWWMFQGETLHSIINCPYLHSIYIIHIAVNSQIFCWNLSH